MLIIVLAAAMLIARAASAQEMSLRAVYNAVSGVMAPIWVGQEGGLFTKHGVNVDLKYLAATTAVQGMVGGGEEVTPKPQHVPIAGVEAGDRRFPIKATSWATAMLDTVARPMWLSGIRNPVETGLSTPIW